MATLNNSALLHLDIYTLNHDLQEIAEHNKKIESQLRRVTDMENLLAKITGPAAASDLLEQTNRKFVSLPSAKAAYASLFARMRTANGAVVYHCTAGKDRTGWATAVLLTALGVPREAVMADYLARNDYLASKNSAAYARMPAETVARLKPIYTVQASYLRAAFDEVDRRYG